VADALHSAAIHLLRGVRKEDLQTGLGPARLSALSVLVFGGPMRVSDLARLEQVRPPTMTKIVNGLADAGLVRRTADAADARAVMVAATAAGRQVLHEGRRRRVARLAAALGSLTAQELAVLERAAAIVGRVTPGI
jgi:DNA-binding MarR family transcriptional regulator